MCRSVKVVKPIHCDALYGFDKDYFFFLCCSCLALFNICNVIQTSDLDKDDSASGPWLRFVIAMVTARNCHGYGLQVPWLRFASAVVTVANSHYNKKGLSGMVCFQTAFCLLSH